MTEEELAAKIQAFKDEAGEVVAWGQEAVKSRRLQEAARLNGKVGLRAVHTFDEL